MGEQGQFYASGHFCSTVMRSSRGKLFIYLALIGAMCFVVFLLSSMHSSIKQLEGTNDKCQQQRDSLSAQLQVVYEHKNRLEKSLQQEKTDHKHTKEENEKQVIDKETKLQQEKENQQILENQISQMKANYAELEETKKQLETSLKEQIHSLQSQKDEEIQKLQEQLNELITEKDKIFQANAALGQKIQYQATENNLCQVHRQQLESKLEECNNEKLVPSQKPNKDNEMEERNEDNAAEVLAKDDQDSKKQIQIQNEVVQNVSDHAVPSNKMKVLDRPIFKSFKDDPFKNFNEQADDEKNKLQNPVYEVSKKDTNFADNFRKPVLPIPLRSKIKESSMLKDNTLSEQNKIEPGLQQSALEVSKAQEVDTGNLPQVQAPVNLLQVAAEKGDSLNYGNAHQVEQPEYKENQAPQPYDLGKNIQEVAHDNENAQMHDMLVKSPADEPKNIPVPPHGYDINLNHLNKDKMLNGRGDRSKVVDKAYEDEDDDDQDGDNEEDPAHGIRGKPFPEMDFNDQDPIENRGKIEEGVIVHPK